jgi:Glycosyl transferase family group 2
MTRHDIVTRPVRVLVTGAGGPAAVSVLKSLRADPSVTLIAADMDSWAAGLYLVPAAERVLIPAGLAAGFADALLARCVAMRADIVIPTVDSELRPLAVARARYAAAGAELLLAPDRALELTLDKLALARGAQLHSRANIEAIGGRIDTASLAEDTVTTFLTQLAGQRVIFEPHARVWAEEPITIGGLWKQRVRWARGNIQITRRFRHLWFRPQAGHRLGSVSFGLFWFSLLLLPFMMICASASLVTLFFINYQQAWTAFHVLWIINVITYVFITSYTLLIDPAAGKYVWRAALAFPGVINVLIIVAAVLSHPMWLLAGDGMGPLHLSITPPKCAGSSCLPTSG